MAKTRFYSANDEWENEAPNIDSSERRSVIKDAIDAGPVIVEHWFYRGSSAPDRMVFDDPEELDEYLRTKTYAGDFLRFWKFHIACDSDNCLIDGKCPNENGL